MEILIDLKKNIKKLILNNGIECSVVCERSDHRNFLSQIKSLKGLDRNNLIKFVKKQDGFFRFAIWNKNFFFGSVDQVASKTILYKKQDGKLNVYFNAPNSNYFNFSSVIDIFYSGYSIKNETIFKNIKSLLPGECIYYENNKEIVNFNWNHFNPTYHSKNRNEKELTQILIRIFENIIQNNSNKRFLIPLSAGFDSRLVVSLMKYLGASFETFTYGFNNQRDFKIAKEICAKLNIKNHKIIMDNNNSKVYQKKKFKEFLEYKNFGIAANNFGDFGPLSILDKKINKNEFMILNGQSGDFLTGGHLPIDTISEKNSSKKNKSSIFNFILSKHYSLWNNHRESIKQDYFNKLNKYYFKHCQNYLDFLKCYEIYEFENRQSKWVIGQQKVYEFLGYTWELPLWKISIMKFFEKKIGLKEKINQNYYKSYLIKKNYSNVWKNVAINPNLTFPTILSLFIIFFKIIFFFKKRDKWHLFRKKYLEYFLDPTGVISLLTYKKYINLTSVPRNSISIISKKYFNKYKKR